MNAHMAESNTLEQRAAADFEVQRLVVATLNRALSHLAQRPGLIDEPNALNIVLTLNMLDLFLYPQPSVYVARPGLSVFVVCYGGVCC